MNRELYDKILTLMSVDSAYEKDFGYRYVEQDVFDVLLLKANVEYPDMEFIEERMELIMDKLIKELL